MRRIWWVILGSVLSRGASVTSGANRAGVVVEAPVEGTWLYRRSGQTFWFRPGGRLEMGHLDTSPVEITHDWRVTSDHQLCIYNQPEAPALHTCYPYEMRRDGPDTWLYWGESSGWVRVADR